MRNFVKKVRDGGLTEEEVGSAKKKTWRIFPIFGLDLC